VELRSGEDPDRLRQEVSRSFEAVFAAEGVKVQRVGPVVPNLNAHAQRFAQSLRAECLDHFVICGEGHLRHLLKEYLEHYNSEGPHQAKGNLPLPEADLEGRAVLRFPSGEVHAASGSAVFFVVTIATRPESVSVH
jgi:hypothetical protein